MLVVTPTPGRHTTAGAGPALRCNQRAATYLILEGLLPDAVVAGDLEGQPSEGVSGHGTMERQQWRTACPAPKAQGGSFQGLLTTIASRKLSSARVHTKTAVQAQGGRKLSDGAGPGSKAGLHAGNTGKKRNRIGLRPCEVRTVKYNEGSQDGVRCVVRSVVPCEDTWESSQQEAWETFCCCRTNQNGELGDQGIGDGGEFVVLVAEPVPSGKRCPHVSVARQGDPRAKDNVSSLICHQQSAGGCGRKYLMWAMYARKT